MSGCPSPKIGRTFAHGQVWAHNLTGLSLSSRKYSIIFLICLLLLQHLECLASKDSDFRNTLSPHDLDDSRLYQRAFLSKKILLDARVNVTAFILIIGNKGVLGC